MDVNTDENGFTLLEVMVALIVLAIGFGSAFRLMSADVSQLGMARQDLAASALAESLFARVGYDMPLEGKATRDGEISGFRWSVSIQPVDWPSPSPSHRIAFSSRWKSLSSSAGKKLTGLGQ